MTESDFINLHTNNGPLNTTGTINVNIDLSVSSIGTVTGITVTNIPQINPPSTFKDLIRVLEEVTDIKFKIGNTVYSLSIQERRLYTNTVPNLSFFYFRTVPFNFIYDPGTIQSQDVSVSLYPFLLGSKLTFSDYNPLIDNVIEQRRAPSGSRIVESDRNSITVSPSNINAILTGSATLAAVQESNYTATGWSNGRYNGSKTNARNYGGISPTLSGRTTTGAVYASQVLDNSIVSQSLSTRTIQDIFHTGRELTPTYEIVSSSYKTATVMYESSSTVRIAVSGSVITGSFDINTLIKVEEEKMRVVNYYENSNGIFLDVTRGLFNTTKSSHPTSSIEIITPTFLYTYDTVRRQETPVTNAKVWVEETANIYYTDTFGAIYSGSIYNT